MKYITSIIKLLSLALLLIVGYACTDNFDKINRKDYQVDKEELGRESYNVGASLKGLQGLVIPTEEHLYQFVEALGAGAFAGYIGCTVEWTAKFETYRLARSSFFRFSHSHLSVLSGLVGQNG